MSRRVHMPKLGTNTSIIDKAPLLCGQARDDRSHVTIFARLATCSRCVKANALAQDDLDYKRAQAKLRREFEEQVSA